jgi:EpsI family protein
MTGLLKNKALRAVTVVLIIQAGLFYAASRGESAVFCPPLSAFPTVVGPWSLVQEGTIEQETRDLLKADDIFTRTYGSTEGGVNLFVAYFKTQRTGQSPHSPKNCLPGAGWQPSESSVVTIQTSQGPISINRYLVSKGDNQSLVYYWYQSHGRVIADEFSAKFYLVADSIRQHRSDTALVRVVVGLPPRGEVDHAEKIGTDFIKTFYPVVAGYLPH